MNKHEHILFVAGGMKLAIAASSIQCVHDGLHAQAEANTPAWFLGLAVADDKLLPITDLGVYLGGAASHGRVIEVARRFGIAGLRVDDINGISREIPQSIEPSSTFSDDTSANESALSDLAVLDDTGAHRIVDVAQLMQSTRFLDLECEAS